MYKSNWRKRTTKFQKKTSRDKVIVNMKTVGDLTRAMTDNNDTDVDLIKWLFDK